MGFFAYCALAFRHDGILPVALTVCGLLLYFWRKRRALVRPLLRTVLCVFAVHLAVTEVLAFRILDAQRSKTYTAFGTPMYLLAAVVNSGKPMDERDQALLEEVMPLSDWAASQNPPHHRYTVDYVSRAWGVPGDRIGKVNRRRGVYFCLLTAKYFFRYPGVVLDAFFTINSLAWEISTPDAPGAAPPIMSYDMQELDAESEKELFFQFELTGFAEWTQRYAFFVETTPVLREILLRGGLPLLSLLFGSYILWKKRRRELLLCSLPVFGAWLVQFMLLCAQDPRYLLPVHVWMTFLPLYAFAAPAQEPAGRADGPAPAESAISRPAAS